MKIFRRLAAWVLLFTIIVNPVLFESRVWAEGTASTTSKTGTAQAQVVTGDQKVQDMKEVKLSWSDKIGLGIGSWCDGKSWSYYSNKVDEANKKMTEAKGKSTDSKAQTEKSQKDGTQAAGMKSSLQQTASAKAVYQKCLLDTGNDLVRIAGLLKIIGLALCLIGSCLSAVAVGAVVAALGAYLGYIATALEAAGNSIIKAAQSGASGDSVWAGAVTGAVKGYISAEAKGPPSSETAAAALGTSLGGNSTLTDAINAGYKAVEGSNKNSKTAPDTKPANYVETPSSPAPDTPGYGWNPDAPNPSNYVETNPAPAQTGEGTSEGEDPAPSDEPGGQSLDPETPVSD